jgi:hypothetical protein
MKDSIKKLMAITEELVLDYVGSTSPELKINVTKSNMGANIPFSATLTRQLTMDDFIDEEGGMPSFLVFDVAINPRAFKKMSCHELAMEIHRDYLKKVREGY